MTEAVSVGRVAADAQWSLMMIRDGKGSEEDWSQVQKGLDLIRKFELADSATKEILPNREELEAYVSLREELYVERVAQGQPGFEAWNKEIVWSFGTIRSTVLHAAKAVKPLLEQMLKTRELSQEEYARCDSFFKMLSSYNFPL
jgi:hypothetical protein